MEDFEITKGFVDGMLQSIDALLILAIDGVDESSYKEELVDVSDNLKSMQKLLYKAQDFIAL